jgi:branched-chain amino acid transport system permease protein
MVFGQILLDGLLLGGIYAVIALGFSLVWGIMNIINVSHGAFVMLGAYVTYWITTASGLDPFVALPVTMVIMFGLGAFLQRYMINYVIRAPAYITVTLTFGLELLIVNLALAAWTANFRSITVSYSGARFFIGPFLFPYTRVLIFLVALLLTILMHLFITRTKTGTAIRATRMDLESAKLNGVNVRRIYIITFGVGAALAGAAGGMIAITYPISPMMGFSYLAISFIIAVLGGLGSMAGPLIGGLIFGLIEALGSFFIGTGYKGIIAFTLFVIILLVRPSGILGREYY